jgi:hypothetical protein
MGTLIKIKGTLALVGTPGVGIEAGIVKKGEGILLSGKAVGQAAATLGLTQGDDVEVEIIKPDPKE